MKNPLLGTKKEKKPPFIVSKLSVDTTSFPILYTVGPQATFWNMNSSVWAVWVVWAAQGSKEKKS